MVKGAARGVFLWALVAAFAISVAPAKESATTTAPEAAPAWTVQFDHSIRWQRLTPLGHLIVGTSAGLQAVDPSSGTVLWHHGDLSRMSGEGFRNILNTPFVMLSGEDSDDRIVILDSMAGTILFDSRREGFTQVLSTHTLPSSGNLVVFGFREGHGTMSMSLLDVASAKLRWTNDDLFGSSGWVAKLAATLYQAVDGDSGVSPEPLEIGADAFLLASGTGIYRVNSRTGDFDWRVPNIDGVSRTRFYVSPKRPGVFFAGAEVPSSGEATSGWIYTYYRAYRLNDGKALWPKPIKLRGGANDVVFLDEGMMISSGPDGNGKIKLLDYEAGKSLWGKKGKGIEAQGSVVDHELLDGDVLIATGHDSAWTDKGVVFYLNIVDVTAGALRFSKSLKVKGRLLGTEVTPKGVLYVTTSEINFLDPSTGRPLHKRSVFSDGTLITARKDDSIYAFSRDEGALFVVDTREGTLRRLGKEKIELGDRDVPDLLEVSSDRITLSSSQNIVAFEPDGAVLFHVHHPAPKQPGALKALLIAQAVRAAMASAVSGTYSGSFARAASHQEDGSAGEAIATELAQGYADMADGYAALSGDYVKAARARFKASAQADDFVFMMVASPGKGVELARVSKKTGEIVARIPLGRDRTPDYQVDLVSDRVYYLADPTAITGYAF